jgi:hypothetical protein
MRPKGFGNEKPLVALIASARGFRVLMGIGSLACCEIRRNQRLDTSLLYAKEKLPKTAPESAYASAPSLKLHSTVMDHLLSSDGSMIETRPGKSQVDCALKTAPATC